jgi:hypothetical protein
MGVDGIDKPHIDHINHNGLDNRRINLRFATIGQNNKNRKLSKVNTTGYRGVSIFKKKDGGILYKAAIFKDGKTYHGGYFKLAEDAAAKYNELALKFNGEFAGLNTLQ